MNITVIILESILIGIVSGFLSSFLGIGGGIAVLPFLTFILNLPIDIAIGTTNLIVFMNGLISSLMHLRLRNFKRDIIPSITTFGIVGTILGSIIFQYLRYVSWILKILVGIYFIYVSSRSMLENLNRRVPIFNIKFNSNNVIPLLGIFSGFIVGILGMGAGSILVPVLSYGFNIPIKIAIGTSLICFTPMSFISAIIKLISGSCNYLIAFYIMPGLVIGARVGSKLLMKSSVRIVRFMFSIVFLILGVKFILDSISTISSL